MRGKLIEASVTTLIKKGIIDSSERDLYLFGINQLFLFIINFTTSVVIGLICGMLWQSVLFSLAYIPLRRYAGGYHAKTPGRCYILSIILILSALTLINIIKTIDAAVICCFIISAIIIFIKAPVASSNKPLNSKEKTAFARRTRIILLVELLVTIIVSQFNLEAAICLIIAICCGSLMIVISLIQLLVTMINRNIK